MNAEMEYKKKNNFKKSFAMCSEKEIPFILIVGEYETENNTVKLKFQVDVADYKTKDSIELKRENMGDEIEKIVRMFRESQSSIREYE